MRRIYNAGELRDQVKLYRKINHANDYGEVTDEVELIKSVKGKVLYNTATVKAVNTEALPKVKCRVMVRNYSKIHPVHQVEVHGVRYDVINSFPVDRMYFEFQLETKKGI